MRLLIARAEGCWWLGLVFFDSDRRVAHVTAGVDEGDHFSGILFEGLVGNLLAVIQESIHVLQHILSSSCWR